MKRLFILIGIISLALIVFAQDRDGRSVKSLVTVSTGATTYVAVDYAGRCQYSWLRLKAWDATAATVDSINIVGKWCKRTDITRAVLYVNNSDSIHLVSADSGTVKSYSGSIFQPPAASNDSLSLMFYTLTGHKVGTAIQCSVWLDCRYGN